MRPEKGFSFDHALQLNLTEQLLSDAHILMEVALHKNIVARMEGGVFYLHPDKAPELWIYELGVSSAYRRRGIATWISREVQTLAVENDCQDCWLLIEPKNDAANALYQSLPDWPPNNRNACNGPR